MFWEKRLTHWADTIRNRSALPLRLDLWDGQQLRFSQEIPQVVIRVPHVSALSYLLKPSLSNLGEAYVDGKIEVDGKASAIIQVGNALASNTLKLDGKFGRVVRKLHHSKEKDRAAIRYHYDVSNEFYQIWLDPGLVYSCAYFENGDEDLASAQIKKIDHILNKIRLQPGQTLLDIGCGWGALLLRAAEKYGAKCVGVTLSENQAALAKARVARAGLSDRVEIRLEDYRDLGGTFDRITSVGMFEHVGLNHLSAYFQKIQSLLADDGVAMNHGITSTDADSGGTPYGCGEFVDRYIFPQGELPHLGLALKSMQEGGLEALDIENLRRHYARTCECWLENFESHSDQIRHLVDDRTFRIWRVYLAGCAYGFAHDWISIYQIVCAKAGRYPASLPWSRRFMYQPAGPGTYSKAE